MYAIRIRKMAKAVVVYSPQCEMYVMTDLQIQTGQDEERKGGGG